MGGTNVRKQDATRWVFHGAGDSKQEAQQPQTGTTTMTRKVLVMGVMAAVLAIGAVVQAARCTLPWQALISARFWAGL